MGEALLEMALLAGHDSAASFRTQPDWKADLLARAVARAARRRCIVEAVARRAWETAHVPAVASALSDLRSGRAAWPDGRPTPPPRARRPAGFATALDLEVALDAERGARWNGACDLRQRHRHRSGWAWTGIRASRAPAATCWAKRGRWRGWAPSSIRASAALLAQAAGATNGRAC